MFKVTSTLYIAVGSTFHNCESTMKYEHDIPAIKHILLTLKGTHRLRNQWKCTTVQRIELFIRMFNKRKRVNNKVLGRIGPEPVPNIWSYK